MNILLTLAGTVSLALLPVMAWGANSCPPELTEAKGALKSVQAAMKKGTQATPKSQDVQAPRVMAGARAQDVQAPRAQDVQAPRAQDVQAPRAMAGAKAQSVQPEQLKKAGALIREADVACKKGDMALSSQKANEALGLLK